MKAIETTVFVDEKGQFTLQLPKGVVPGRHRVILVIDEQVNEQKYKDSGDGGLAVIDVEQTEMSAKRRTFPDSMVGKVRILGDIVSPMVDEDDWECLK